MGQPCLSLTNPVFILADICEAHSQLQKLLAEWRQGEIEGVTQNEGAQNVGDHVDHGPLEDFSHGQEALSQAFRDGGGDQDGEEYSKPRKRQVLISGCGNVTSGGGVWQ